MATTLTRSLSFQNFSLAIRDIKDYFRFQTCFKRQYFTSNEKGSNSILKKNFVVIIIIIIIIFGNKFYVASDIDRHMYFEISHRLIHIHSHYFCYSPFLRFTLKVCFCTLQTKYMYIPGF
jgi:hypothetical protein